MKKLLSILAIATLGVGLSTGMVSAATIDTTGPGSTATLTAPKTTTINNKNVNVATVVNTTVQTAWSGDADVQYNTRGGDAETGNAENESSTAAEISINNGGHSQQQDSQKGPNDDHKDEIKNTGPNSTATLYAPKKLDVKQTNVNVATVVNTTVQTARSGDADVKHNTHGGDAKTGDAKNKSDSSAKIHIAN